MLALAVLIKLPSVIATLQAVVVHTAQRKLGAAVGAAVCPGVNIACCITPEHKCLLQELHGNGFVGNVNCLRDGMPECLLNHALKGSKKNAACDSGIL